MMNLLELIHRESPPIPWAEGEKIPWSDPAFSQRMLAEHLSHEHDAASRRATLIDRHVTWIHHGLLAGRPGKILDLGCGPGLYTGRLAQLGHQCVGIDYGPAAVAYARQQAEEQGLACRYVEADVREADYGAGYDLVMMIHGELTVFRPPETRAIVAQSYAALNPGGQLVVEVHPLAAVEAIGRRGATWYSSTGGLFSERPHLCLRETYWDAGRQVATERYYIVDGQSRQISRHAASIQGYGDEEFVALLEASGFRDVARIPSLVGPEGEEDGNYIVLVARKAA